MDTYSFTPEYLTKNGIPWFPVMGEMHYSRYPEQYWKESLYKIKAGGVDIVSTYAIWIHHEEIEGEWDFTGNRNLRRFVEDVRDCGLKMLLRIGPWCHGEVRNGGFPDWLLHKDFRPRTNDQGYLDEVAVWYKKLSEQVRGLLEKDGGPIISVQIENEFGHCGGMAGPEGEKHMSTLTAMAKDAGFDVPLYTATGWGGAVTGGLIPVMGGYVEAPWDQRITEIEPSGNYVFTYERNDHNIGSDFGFGKGITFDIKKFPYLTAELGGGLQVTYKRRPVASAADIGAMTLVKLGSGVNLLGYYMYHGGTNPKGKHTTLQESVATGSINDLPLLNYDFRAPVREYGQISDTYRELRLYAQFIHDFGGDLCRMPAHIPAENPLAPADMDNLRYSWRYNEKNRNGGYLFVNNYVRRNHTAEHLKHTFTVPSEAAAETISFPVINVCSGDYFFLPFNMRIGDAVIRTALVSPLCILHAEPPVYVFYRNSASGTFSDESLYTFADNRKPASARILTISRDNALNAEKVTISEKEYLIVSDSTVTVEEGKLVLAGYRVPGFKTYPALRMVPAGFIDQGPENGFEVYKYAADAVAVPSVKVLQREILRDQDTAVYEITLPDWRNASLPDDVGSVVNDCILSIAYEGNGGRLYQNDELIADSLYIGRKHPWQIGLKRFYQDVPPDTACAFRIEIDALSENAQIFLEDWPVFNNGHACMLTGVQAIVEYRTIIMV
jgi:beta-galactosidase